MKKEKQKNKGITLIALVITIVVLLILAGVSIATVTLTGGDGLIERASEAAEKTGQVDAEEQVQIAVLKTIGTDGNVDLDKLNDELAKIDGLTYNGSAISESNKIESLPVTVLLSGYEITIDENGDISTL